MQPAAAQPQQQHKPWWLQGPCALVRGAQDNLARLAAAAPPPPWAPRPQQQSQQQPAQQVAAAAKPKAAAASAHRQQHQQAPQPVTREELGRATWTFLHTLAAQFPDRPSRSQQRDARALIGALTRIYPCGDCARHFAEIVAADPPEVSTGDAFRRWMCRAHNAVNRSVGKPAFNCDLAAARWAPLDCDRDGPSTCDLVVGGNGGGRRR